MSARKFKLKKYKRPMSINTSLWISFTALLLMVVAILGVGQYALLNNAYTEQVMNGLLSEGQQIYREIKESSEPVEPAPFSLNAYLVAYVLHSGHSVSILNDEGDVLYPNFQFEMEEKDYSGVIGQIKNKLSKYGTGNFVAFTHGSECYVAGSMELYNEWVYLCLSSPVGISKDIQVAMITQIIFVSLIVMILSFIIVGIISSKISEPIAAISKKAKKMGKGDFDVDFYEDAKSWTEIAELSSTLNYTRDELSKADQMQKDLIANVTHDFKTPLTMIKAYASMIQEISGDIPEKRNKHCQVIIDESDRLAALVNDMLDISKIRSGINTLKFSVFNLSEFTKTIVDRFGYLTETQGYTIITDIAPDLFTEADKDKIGQVIYNLIGNAVNYTGEDKKITVRLVSSGGFIRFDVTDTGSGIKKEEIDTIWDRYYRSSEMHKRPVKGTGLGLSIVKTVLTKHAFKFGVLSELGKGTTFYVDFPIRTVWSIESADPTSSDE